MFPKIVADAVNTEVALRAPKSFCVTQFPFSPLSKSGLSWLPKGKEINICEMGSRFWRLAPESAQLMLQVPPAMTP